MNALIAINLQNRRQSGSHEAAGQLV